MQNEMINAGTHPVTLNPGNRRSASLIIITDTKTFIKNVINPSVRISIERRIEKPIVALRHPTTKATNIAVV